jgi:hypothetical protein
MGVSSVPGEAVAVLSTSGVGVKVSQAERRRQRARKTKEERYLCFMKIPYVIYKCGMMNTE